MCEAMGIHCTEWHVKVALGEIEACYRTLNGPTLMDLLRKSRGKKLKGDVRLKLRTGP